MQSRLLLAILLSIGVLVAWNAIQPTPAPKPKPVDPPVAEVPTPGPSPAPGPAPSPAPDQPSAPAEEVAETFVVRPETGPWAEVGFSTQGASIRFLTLRDSYERPDRRHRLDVILPGHPDLRTGMVEVEGDAGTLLVDRRAVWKRDEAAEAKTPALDVVFVREAGGLRFEHRYVLPTEAGRFDADVSLTAVATSPDRAGKPVIVRLLAAAGHVSEPTNNASFTEPERFVHHVATASGDPVYGDYGLESTELDLLAREGAAFRLVGVRSQYFGVVLWHPGGREAPRVTRLWGGGVTGDAGVKTAMRDGLAKFFREERDRSLAEEGQALAPRLTDAVEHFWQAWAHVEVPVGKADAPAPPTTFHLFAGPLDRHVLGAERYEGALRPLITYPVAFDFLAVILLSIFDFFHGLTASAGLAVILMTLVVRGGMMPLSVKNQLSMRRHGRKVQRLRPKLEALKKKWAHDRRRFQEEQVKLYREHGVGFPMGCLMLLIQIPVFMALFSSLRVEYGLRHQAFAWIEDLSGPDTLVDFGGCFDLLGIPPGGICGINLIPLLSVALSFWQYRLMPKPTDEQQAQQMKMMKWFPVFFAVLLYNYTAALSIYMVISSVVAILESMWVRAKDLHETEGGPPATA